MLRAVPTADATSAMPPKPSPTRRPAIGIIAAAFVVYAAIFIYRTSFNVAGERYFCLFDDEMISMRYARNLARGEGLVWNPGAQRVEGISNPLWTLVMAGIHRLRLPESKVCLAVQILGAALLLLNLLATAGLARALGADSFSIAGAALLTGFYLPLNTWGLLGTEVSALTLLYTISLRGLLRSLSEGDFDSKPYLLLGLGTWIRLDFTVAFLACAAFMAVFQPRHRPRHLLWGAPILAFFLISQTLLRVWYYGDLLPNTYYLKMTGFPLLYRMTRGAYELLNFAWRMNILVFLLPFLVTIIARKASTGLLLWAFVCQASYSVYVGGDAWEWWGGSNRFISVAMPGFFALISSALGMARPILSWAASDGWRASPFVRRSAGMALIALCLFSVNAIHGPEAWAPWLLVSPGLHVPGNEEAVRQGLQLRALTTPQASIAVTWAGAAPYFSDRPASDLLGKSDRLIAREPARILTGRSIWVSFYPGHQKWDYAYSIGSLRPDVVVSLWHGKEGAEPFLSESYRKVESPDGDFFARKDSPHVRWERLEPATAASPGE